MCLKLKFGKDAYFLSGIDLNICSHLSYFFVFRMTMEFLLKFAVVEKVGYQDLAQRYMHIFFVKF